MKHLLLIFFLLVGLFSFSQSAEEQLAADYFKKGQFEKALIAYQNLYETQPRNYSVIFNLMKTYQELEQFDKAETLIKATIKAYRNPSLIIELGYNYQLSGQTAKATKAYDEAFAMLEERPDYALILGRQFEHHAMFDLALKSYERGMELDPESNYHQEMANIYGEQGNIEMLFSNYLQYLEFRPGYVDVIKREFSEFISENKTSENNRMLRRLLLKNIQIQPDTYWYELLSWLYIQEKDYGKAFLQEKALYMREHESLDRILEVASIALNAKEYDQAATIFTFVLENTQDLTTILTAQQQLLAIAMATATPQKIDATNAQFKSIFEKYGLLPQTLDIQIMYADFLAFHVHKPIEASQFLKETLKLNLSSLQQGMVKMKLGDILVLQEKFNEALIYYTQIQTNLKNSPLAQEARFKVAKTSYYKGDFVWAESQLKILKASTSQLIANDALELKLLISDNKYEDSLQVALKLYAKADLKIFQNKSDEAINLLDQILNEHKGESIEAQALFTQAKLFTDKKQYDKAIRNYEHILAFYKEGILADDAYYFLAELYNNILEEPEKAKAMYEKIIFNHQDSIYYVEARKKFRMLRGDSIN